MPWQETVLWAVGMACVTAIFVTLIVKADK